eukprot:CAMPEP_0181307402 /NCGR_PEP_ID=MMETSP1101-20121128/10860_1 /TAXON_ID=46948 /ORGANISM="Rhodomonas abbreviata, Strain Caron Lab Isolate" /LENGTH=74 /DNA_ID=CAMNT_0023413615 /DNA_START=1 /DNA_END=221 /DNA_ORIENTATION=+
MSMRAGVLVAESGNGEFVEGNRLMNVAYSGHTYSSAYGGDAVGTGHARGQLDSEAAWSVQESDDKQWMQLDVGA